MVKKEDKKLLDTTTPREFIDELKNETNKAIKKLDDSTEIDEKTANVFKNIIKGLKDLSKDPE